MISNSIMGEVKHDMLPIGGGRNCQISVMRILLSKLSVNKVLSSKLVQTCVTNGVSIFKTVETGKLLLRGTTTILEVSKLKT